MGKRRGRGEGSVFYREDRGIWIAQLPLPDGKRKYKHAKTQKEAREWLLTQRKAVADGLFADDGKVTVGEFVNRWFNDVKTPLLKLKTIETNERIIRVHIYPTVGEIRLSQLTPAHLQNLYTQKLKSGLSKRTVKYIHTILRQALDQALKWGLVARNVADAVEAPTPDKRPVEPPTLEQVRKLLEVLEGDRLYPLYVVFLGAGLRRGEALALTKDCIDWEAGLIHVRKSIQSIKGRGLVISEPKSETSYRTVGMPDFVSQSLATHLANRPVDSDYIFCTSKGTPFVPRNILRHFKKALKKAELPETTRIHDLRHFFVSWMLSQNVPPKDVQIIAGHADYSTTMNIYGHLMPGAKKEAARKFDKLFEK